jgi:hypothetical protein
MNRNILSGSVHLILGIIFIMSSLQIIPDIRYIMAILLFLVGGYFFYDYFKQAFKK